MSVVVEGTVVGSGQEPLLYDAELRIAGGDPSKHLKRGAISITTGDGNELTINTDRATILVARTESNGKWGDLLDNPLTRPFDGEAPGDHVEVMLAGVAVSPGDRVAVLGNEDEHLSPDGYRGSERGARAIDAMVLAAGKGANSALTKWQKEEDAERKQAHAARAAKEKGPSRENLSIGVPLALAGIGALATLVGLWMWLGDTGPRVLRAALPAYGIALLAIGFYVARRRRFLPTFDVVGKTSDAGGSRMLRWSASAGAWVAWFMVCLGGMALLAAALAMPPGARALLAVSALGPLYFAWELVRQERHSVRFLRGLLRTAAYQPGESGSRTLTVTVALGTLTRRYRATRSKLNSSWASWHEEQRNAQSFEITGRTPDGTEVTIHPGEAVFGSSTRTVRMEEDADGDPIGVAVEEVGRGDTLIVLGRPRKKGNALKVDSTGPESLIIFGAKEKPRSVARRALFAHYVSVLGLLGLAGLALALAWVNPYFTHESLHGEVTSVTGLDIVHLGDPCVLEVGHTGAHDAHLYACRARLTCGGVELFGSQTTGYFDCSLEDGRWETPTDDYADPRIRLSPPNHVEVRPGEGRAVQILVSR